MSTCLRCGAHLPPVGDCPSCAAGAGAQPAPPPLAPALLRRELRTDRRQPESTQERTQRAHQPTAEAVVHAKPAAHWRRLLAWMVDLAAISALVFIYLVIAALVTGRKPPATHLTGIDSAMVKLHALEPIVVPALVLAAVVALVYSAVFNVVWDGRTPGRRLLNIQLVDRSGISPTPWRAVARSALSGLSALFFLGGYFLALFDRHRQTLHDKLTRTFVVQTAPEA